jgi:ubiquinone/menaquinone biosynthesis C-methylase UbiE
MKIFVIIILLFGISSCKSRKTQEESKKVKKKTNPEKVVKNPENDKNIDKPKINCPHANSKGKVDPHKRPHKSIKEYIKHLEDPNRVKWQKPEEVIKALKLKGSEIITDLGAGSGFFSFRFSKAIPKGKVFACDIEQKMIDYLNKKIEKFKFKNVIAQKICSNKPQIDKNTDLIFINNVLHHVENKVSWLKTIKSQMKSKSKLVILEFKMGKLPAGPPESMRLSKEQILKLTKEAGFNNSKEILDILPYQVFLIFEN